MEKNGEVRPDQTPCDECGMPSVQTVGGRPKCRTHVLGQKVAGQAPGTIADATFEAEEVLNTREG